MILLIDSCFTRLDVRGYLDFLDMLKKKLKIMLKEVQGSRFEVYKYIRDILTNNIYLVHQA